MTYFCSLKHIKTTLIPVVLAISYIQCVNAADPPITLKTMGSFAFGGSVNYRQDRTTIHGDHGYAQYYIPSTPRHYPIVMWHGVGQSGRSFESTPDGREGFQALLPRDNYPVYIIDQPRRGRAGYTAAKQEQSDIPTVNNEADLWEAFRIGPWVKGEKAQIFTQSAFPLNSNAVNQFFRQQTPNTAEEPRTAEFNSFIAATGKSLFDTIGDSILLTHSRARYYGWEIAMASDKVKAVIAFEPGACAFPEKDPPENLVIVNEMVARNTLPPAIPDEKWQKLLKIPILVIFGDNIATQPQYHSFNGELWRIAELRAKQFVSTINRHGGDATFISLPDLGLKGNTHAPFADLNNKDVLKVVENFLTYKELDTYDNPHQGPKFTEINKYTIPISKAKANSWE